MDHVLNAIQPYFDVTLREFMKENTSGDYQRLSDNPIYGELKAIVDSMNCINKYLGWETIKISDEVKHYYDS